MTHGPAFDRILYWDAALGGTGSYVARGPWPWDACRSITVYLMQGDVVAEAHGDFDQVKLDGAPSWILRAPFDTELNPGDAQAAALSIGVTGATAFPHFWPGRVTLAAQDEPRP